MAERQEHPPRPGCRDPGAGVIGYHGVATGNAERGNIARELFGTRIHMRPRVVAIGDVPDIEKHRAWNMRAEIIVRWQRQHARHLVGRVDDFDLRIVETSSEPVSGGKRIVGRWCHAMSSQLSSWPGIAVQRTASFPLAYARPSTFCFVCCKDVDARDI